MIWTRAARAPSALAILLAACGGDPILADLDSECGLAVIFGGGVEAALDAHSMVTCSSQPGASAGVGIYFSIVDDEHGIERIEVAIDEVTRGQTGAGFGTGLLIEIGSERFGSRDCTATIASHDAIAAAPKGERHRLRGAIACSGEATAEGGAATAVTIERFDWAATVVWR